MDFYKIRTKEQKNGRIELYPDFEIARFKDLMVKGKSFYGIWDEERGLWSTDLYDVPRLVDAHLKRYSEELSEETRLSYTVKNLRSNETGIWRKFIQFTSDIADNHHPLDTKLTFADTEVTRADFVSKRLPYSLKPGDYSAWDELVGTLYSPDERAKIEWAIGAVVHGDSKKIQKFLVLYGSAGTGKSTILNIIEKLFDGYTTTFNAKALGQSNNSFSTEVFKSNPLVAIQHDGDLSKIQDNTLLNSIIAHENMAMNEKYKAAYTAKVDAFLFMGTNTPVKISDSNSGLKRRLIDVHPTGVTLPPKHYEALIERIDFELGAIAHHCLEVYLKMGKNAYKHYEPKEMMYQTDVFYNFIQDNFDEFKADHGISLKRAYTIYQEYCDSSGIPKEQTLPMYKFRAEFKSYFDEFHEKKMIEGHIVRSVYSGFKTGMLTHEKTDTEMFSLVMDETESLLDKVLADQPAQLAVFDEETQIWRPERRWDNAKSKLSDLDTSLLHYVQVPRNHIVIDFDIVDETGEKSLERNLEAASKWPPTYSELSKGGAGIHLHYEYDGDVEQLANHYDEGIEVKTLLGEASLRRKVSKCNNVPVATINSGLPFKEKKLLSSQTVQSERGLRDLIRRNLNKEFHPGTKPSVDFIAKILDDAYESGMEYNVTDMRPKIIAFANNSTNQSLQALKTVQNMRWESEPKEKEIHVAECKCPECAKLTDDRLVFYDVEVYPNLFVVCWKYEGDANIVRMINPTAEEMEGLFQLKLVGFNNRRYDNHILYARYMGYDNEALYKLSQKIIEGNHTALFAAAYNLSYTDIYDFSSKKQGLKKFQIELGIHHQEMDIPWDQPVPDDMVMKVVEYCCNDVESTESVFKSREGDWKARLILAELSGLTPNDTTQKHTAKIIFGDDRRPQNSFIYTDLSKEFPGYEFDRGKSHYQGELVGEGGYVYAEPGIYENVVLLDVESMHPTSIRVLDLFGPEYTKRFNELLEARLAIKHEDMETAGKMLDGALKPYITDPEGADALSYALKIVINIVYGLTSAKFDNPFRDNRNIDNIVAKRGALFMIDLKHACQEMGLRVVHIKTDSIKIPNATPEDIEMIKEFGAKYGYKFAHEATYEKMALVNDAVYIAKYAWHEKEKKIGQWDATGAQFAHPYVFKTLFTHEELTFDDLCETKQVSQGVMYLDLEHDRPAALVEGMQHIGRTGRFVPVTKNGGILYRVKDDKQYAVTGTKGYLWIEAEHAQQLGDDLEVDINYFEHLGDEAVKTINKFGSFEEFVGETNVKKEAA